MIDLESAPLELHRVHVRPDGTVEARNVQRLKFRFQHHGFYFKGRIKTDVAEPLLELAGGTGMLPFTAQDTNRRKEIVEIIKSSRSLPNVKFVFRFDNRIFTKGIMPIKKPITATHMMAATVETILIMEPYLQLLSGYLIPDQSKPVH